MAGTWIRTFLVLGALGGMPSILWGGEFMRIDTGWALRTPSNGNVFADSDRPQFIFREAAPGGILQYEVKDWMNTSVCNGSWVPKNDGRLLLDQLPCGCYKLFIRSEQADFQSYVSFSVVPSPAKRTANPDSPYCANTAISWLACPDTSNKRQPAQSYNSMADLARMAGMTMVREMTSWGEFSPQPFKYSWDGRYLDNAKLLSSEGISQTFMFHDAPAWSKSRETPGSLKLPDDLVGLHDFARNAAISFGGMTTAWEFWNEETAPEYCAEPAWDFAAAQKAAYLGFKAGNPQVKVLNGSFPSTNTIERQNPRDGSFFSPIRSFESLLFDNGFGDYFDVFNYHLYELFSEYPLIVKSRNDLLEKYGVAETPSWITELGSNYEGYAGETTFLGDHRMELNDYQARIVAEFVPKSQIIAQSLGIERSFHFALPAYNEGKKVWGLIHWDYTAKPAYVAFANLTYHLANAQFEGTYDLGPQFSAFLYRQPDATQTLVFWSRSELDNRDRNSPLGVDINDRRELPLTLKITSPFESTLSLSDIMGKEEFLTSEGEVLKLISTRFPSYLSGPLGLKPSTRAQPKRVRPSSSKDLSIVFKLLLGDTFSPQRTYAAMTGESGGIALEIYNFSGDVKTGKIEFNGRGSLEGLPDSVTLPPNSKTTLDLRFEVGQGTEGLISLSGVFHGKKTSSILVPIWRIAASNAKAFEFDQPERWQASSSGKMDISHDAQEKALKFHVDFANAQSGECDATPEYTLKLPNESLKGAVGLSFEVKTANDVPLNVYAFRFMAVQNDGKVESILYPIPTPEWTTKFICFSADASPYFNPDNIELLKIGLNLSKAGGAFWLRNVKVIYK